MSDPRKQHVGKTRYEKEAYQNMLKTQHAEDPTFELEETESTNSVINNESGNSSITKPDLRAYEPSKEYNVKEIIVGIIIFGITTVLFLFGMSLNREIGIISERNNQNKEITSEIKEDMKILSNEISKLKIDVEVFKRTDEVIGKK